MKTINLLLISSAFVIGSCSSDELQLDDTNGQAKDSNPELKSSTWVIRDIGIIGSNNTVYHWETASVQYPGQQFAGYGTFNNLSSGREDYAYTINDSLTGRDVVGAAIAKANNGTTPCYAWYRNYKASYGVSNHLDYYRALYSYTLPTGKTPSSIVAIGINPKNNNRCYAWYWDGTYSIGHSGDLDYYSGCVPFHHDANFDAIFGIDFANDGRVYTYYSKGANYTECTYSIGTPDDLTAYGSGFPCTMSLKY